MVETALADAARGAALLKQGDYGRGFALYDAWRSVPGNANSAPALPLPRWRGQDPSGKHILIASEHGFGDQIMYARFARILASRGAKITWLCPPALARLISTMGMTGHPSDQSIELRGVDYYCPSSALPLGFDLTPETVPAAPYVETPRVEEHGVGFMGFAGAKNTPRTMPTDVASQLREALGAIDLDPAKTGAADFYDTASLVAGLRLVVTVDTALAHLAGAMGKPTWILLPYDGDWRWLEGRIDSPWYPSARLFRQPSAGDWGSVAAEILTAARKWPRSGQSPP